VNTFECVLHFILRGYLFPCAEEDTLIHLTVFIEEHVHGYQTREVKYVDIVLDRNLENHIR